MTDSLPPPYLPQEVSDLEIAFPAHALKLMPTMAELEALPAPDEHWSQLADDLFLGLDDIQLLPSEFLVDNGSSSEAAWRHLCVVTGSYEPKHQHKQAALTHLLALWFRWAEWNTKRSPERKLVAGTP